MIHILIPHKAFLECKFILTLLSIAPCNLWSLLPTRRFNGAYLTLKCRRLNVMFSLGASFFSLGNINIRFCGDMKTVATSKFEIAWKQIKVNCISINFKNKATFLCAKAFPKGEKFDHHHPSIKYNISVFLSLVFLIRKTRVLTYRFCENFNFWINHFVFVLKLLRASNLEIIDAWHQNFLIWASRAYMALNALDFFLCSQYCAY